MKKGISINTIAVIATVVFISILTTAIAGIGYKLYHDNVMDSYVSYTETVVEYAYRAADEYSFGDMIAAREMPDGYEKFRSELNKIKDCSDIEYLYAIYFDDINDIFSLHYAINAKTQEELSSGRPLSEIYSYMGKPCEQGAFADDTLLILQKAVKEKKRTIGTLDGYSDEYGHMLNGYHVIYDSNDNAVGLICVEIDINMINKCVHRYINLVIITAFVLTVITIILYLFYIRHRLIKPILSIEKSSEAFVKQIHDNVAPEDLIYENVRISSGKELNLLADNVKSLADSVASYMSNLKTVTAEKERISAELNMAAAIQQSVLPHKFPPFPDRKEFELFASMTPAREVGGDFYDFFLIDEDHLGIVMADVSGKGVPAALFMMVSKVIIQSCAMLGSSAGETLSRTNEAISSNNQEGMFVTVWFGILEISTGRITAANAGHEFPAIMRAGSGFELFKDKHEFVVGGMAGIKYSEYEITLEPGDKLFLYTDGVPEATDNEKKMFGTDRMISALNENNDASPEEITDNVRNAVNKFVKDAEQFDDLTMLCLKYNGGTTE